MELTSVALLGPFQEWLYGSAVAHVDVVRVITMESSKGGSLEVLSYLLTHVCRHLAANHETFEL